MLSNKNYAHKGIKAKTRSCVGERVLALLVKVWCYFSSTIFCVITFEAATILMM